MTTTRPLSLQDPGLRQESAGTILSGHVDGVELYFRTDSDLGLVLGAEPFLCAMLVPAMEQGRDIVVADGLTASAEFLANLDRLQDIYAVWYPAFRKVAIRVETRPGEAPATGRGRGLFFSGGLDACHSLQKYGSRIDTLIYVRGIDMQLDDEALYRECLQSNLEIAQAYDKKLVAIESNVRFFIRKVSRSGIGWGVAQGCGLGSLANVLGMPLTCISSSAAYDDLGPQGSHPLTDPLCSSDRVRIDHIGCEARRHEKLLEVARDDFLLQRIRVCWQDQGLNCGKCEKCLRFRMALTLAGLRSRNFEPFTDYSELDLAPIDSPTHYLDWEDNLRLAQAMGNATAARELGKRLRRYREKQLLKQIDELWLGGALRKLKRKASG
ncbi:hypothetical protein [Luteimonas saliphila]|uniref:hypothetical protein n=1 Tax=Luteimonas saliphila TaxID=2804919 RepID=UPI00192E0762|nr:hypothetical protein [Luteimonas saliphila]